MELYLQHFIIFSFFFFRIHNFKKPYITSFNKKKHLYRKRTRKKFVALALLPKIERIRVTKTPQRKRRAREPVAPPSPALPAPRAAPAAGSAPPATEPGPAAEAPVTISASFKQQQLRKTEGRRRRGGGKEKQKKPLNITVTLWLGSRYIHKEFRLRGYETMSKTLRKNVGLESFKKRGENPSRK